MPRNIIQRLNTEMNAILKMNDFVEKTTSNGADLMGGPPEQFGSYLKSEVDKFRKVVQASKISAD